MRAFRAIGRAYLFAARHKEAQPAGQQRELVGDQCEQRLLPLLGDLVERIDDDELRTVGWCHTSEGFREKSLEDVINVGRDEGGVDLLDLLLKRRLEALERVAEHRREALEQRNGRRLLLVIMPEVEHTDRIREGILHEMECGGNTPAKVPCGGAVKDAAEQLGGEHALAGAAAAHVPEELRRLRVIEPRDYLCKGPLASAVHVSRLLLVPQRAVVVRDEFAAQGSRQCEARMPCPVVPLAVVLRREAGLRERALCHGRVEHY